MELLRSAPSPVATRSVPRPTTSSDPRSEPRDLRGDFHTGLRDGLHGAVGERRVWRIACGDVINRDRCLTVLVEKNKVVLVGPPGETAVLTAGQLVQLRNALQEAAEQAER
ncbi:hypothetical protein V5P93_000041 [Actinokineospora auranticolor]|uniref:Uncharacterized protein n=1 Tax=Actinokineospora auranticolor TaxID=155976 RepID=A0A2S6GSI4_9PSEU|nr:hypothetical protein [Actinokineospora auranticolor]PPK68137.1 hypothetical protein CLV40_106374 [Actinokineospora auranticolor]